MRSLEAITGEISRKLAGVRGVLDVPTEELRIESSDGRERILETDGPRLRGEVEPKRASLLKLGTTRLETVSTNSSTSSSKRMWPVSVASNEASDGVCDAQLSLALLLVRARRIPIRVGARSEKSIEPDGMALRLLAESDIVMVLLGSRPTVNPRYILLWPA